MQKMSFLKGRLPKMKERDRKEFSKGRKVKKLEKMMEEKNDP